ncbi:uncharacterized protein LOC117607638 [Osmia lignaria lignaria]|uniref:uncharacterized protein LOC117607638 n=1 Tax=Osmia lignaria lignaria TaxID=1437193 RepID=UPI00402BCB1C
MPRRSMDLCKWLFLAGLLCSSSCQSVPSTFENRTGQAESKPRVFSPRMDYDEWTPLGRGDPLKNNPTFDYVPPVLDRVQYWLDSHTTEPSAKRDILVLGVTAKKTSPKIPDQFLKFVDGPKFTRSNQEVSNTYRNEFTGSTGAEPPKVVRTTNFRNGPIDYRNQNRIQSIPASYYPSPFYNQKSKPYTMMLPPPLTQKDKIVSFVEPTQQFSTQTEEGPVSLQGSQFYAVNPANVYNQQQQQPAKNASKPPNKGLLISQVETIKSVYAPSSPQPTKSRYESATTASVSFEKSNLIYQSTQTLSGGWPGSNAPLSTPTTSDTSQSTWQTPDYSRDQYEVDHHVAASSNHEVVVEQNANIIVDGDSNENEEVVVGQKELGSTNKASSTMVNSSSSSTSFVSDNDKKNTEEETATGQSFEKMHIVLANSSASLNEEGQTVNEGPVAVVMPTNYSDKKVNDTRQSSEATASTWSVPENMTNVNAESTSGTWMKIESHPVRNSVTGTSILPDDSQAAVLPNRMMPSHQQHFQPTMAPFPPRHPPIDTLSVFAPPQAPLSLRMHTHQPRPNHGTMQFLGSMRPNVPFRLPGSVPMFPPMTHMHAPPIKSTTNHMVPPSMAIDHRLPQTQDFSAMMANSPLPPSSPATSLGAEDHSFDDHRSRMPDSTTIVVTPTPFLPTLSSIGNSLFTVDEQTRGPETTLGNDEKESSIASSVPLSSRPSTTFSSQTTTVPSLTTDPIFSHYKQPVKPIRGPMYLIIQGHSKVKTYKPMVSKHSVPVEMNEVTERQLSKFEQFIEENTKRGNANAIITEKKKAEEKARAEKIARVRENTLMSLVESGLDSFTVSPSASATEDEHQANAVTTIQIDGN